MAKPAGKREEAAWDWEPDKHTKRAARRGKRYDGKDGIRNLLKGLWQRAAKHMPL